MQNGTRGNSPAAQTIPSHRLTTFFHSLKKFQRIPPKSHGSYLSTLRKCIQSVRFASFVLPVGSSVKQNRREKRETARIEGITICKIFWPRLRFCSYIVTNFPPGQTRKQDPVTRPFLQRHRCGRVTFTGTCTHLYLCRIPLCKSVCFRTLCTRKLVNKIAE